MNTLPNGSSKYSVKLHWNCHVSQNTKESSKNSKKGYQLAVCIKYSAHRKFYLHCINNENDSMISYLERSCCASFHNQCHVMF